MASASFQEEGVKDMSVVVDWGSIPEWLASLAAIFALTFGALAARAAWDTARSHSVQLQFLEDADRRRAEAARKWQAGKFAVWVRMGEEGKPQVACFNGSGLPVYKLRISLIIDGGVVGRPVVYSVKGPDAEPGVLNYASRCVLQLASNELGQGESPPDWDGVYRDGRIGLRIEFLDSNGIEWVREADGRLR
jgi:hypothetical protein